MSKRYTIEIFSKGGKIVKWTFPTKKGRDIQYEEVAQGIKNESTTALGDGRGMIPFHAIDYIYRGEQYGE